MSNLEYDKNYLHHDLSKISPDTYQCSQCSANFLIIQDREIIYYYMFKIIPPQNKKNKNNKYKNYNSELSDTALTCEEVIIKNIIE